MKKIVTAVCMTLLIFAGCVLEGTAAKSQAVHELQLESVTVTEEIVEQGGTQTVLIKFNDSVDMERIFLEYCNQNAEFMQSGEKTDDTVEFSLFFEGDAQPGTYRLEAVNFQIDEVSHRITLENFQDIDFEVCGEAAVEESFREEADDSFLKESIHVMQNASFSGTQRKEDIKIVLDPGHDNTHAGAYKNGLREEDLNLQIARYCKQELEEYYGVKVYMTRPDNGSCPYPGRTAARCNEKRIEYADSIGADIFVSLHNNSSTSYSPKGAIVYYPNQNYNRTVSTIGKGLARKIQDRLVGLGLYNNGISMKFSADYKYPDNSTADYYAMIRNGKLSGIPAIIVEHAFMSNSSDVSRFLSSNSKLKALGVADATAIAEYYGLSKEAPKPTPTAAPEPEINTTIRPVVTREPYVTPAEGQVFLDVYEDWYTEYVKYVYDNEIMNGIGVTLKFEPQGEMTKAQVAQVLYNMEGLPKVTNREACEVLVDVHEDWYADAVCWAYNAGVITGDLNTLKFLPDASVKREEMAVMLYRYAVYKEYSTENDCDFSGMLHAEKISSWAMDGMKWAVGNSIISGIEVKDAAGKVRYDLKPQGTATRAQAATILTRFCRAYD